MAYDKNKDKVLWEKKADCGMFNISAQVYSYNEGVAKLQLTRLQLVELGEPQFRKLGRLSLQELNAVLPLITEAKEFMEGAKDEDKEGDESDE